MNGRRIRERATSYVFIRWGEWDEGAFGVVLVEEELEESLDKV
jgi:hypothetical protein